MGPSTNSFKKQDEDDNADIDEIEIDEEVGIVTIGNNTDTGGVVESYAHWNDSYDEDESDDEDDDDEDNDDADDDDDDELYIPSDREAAASDESDNDVESDTSSIKSLLVGRENYEEDDLIKIIKKAKHTKRQQPPDILCEDILGDVSFSPSNDVIAVGTMEGDVYLYNYNFEATELLLKYSAHMGSCRHIEYDESGELLYTVSEDKSIIVAETNGGKFKNAYDNAHQSAINSLSIINEHLFCTGDDDGVVKLWDRRKKQEAFSLKICSQYISSLQSMDESATLACTAGDGTVMGVNMNTRRVMSKSEPYDAEITCSGLFCSNTKLAVGTMKGSLLLYSWAQFSSWNDEFPGSDKEKHAINCMVPITENIVITGLDNGNIRATNLFPMRHIGIVGQHGSTVECLDISKDGTLIASGSINNKVCFWNVEYFEHISLTDKDKTDNDKAREHNLPSSFGVNASDFFAGLA